ncbi:phosphate ABC transporter permease subunit PstC [Kineosporia sp. J2-2]|uniref:Phosphate transport system permease protein n=1 Tax=Kineosporia corallincola TaxID=2835133 RepID=A0ABS5TDD6_9ACTN|nr:phosphate ABC transporter permease subunit PstC [Kineosporia corallincola]MBT0767634.1 phosphate ABC transporter permease subunit PstC [Kineosporia corallincola]
MSTITGHSELDAEPSGDSASTGRRGDRIFGGLATGSGIFVIVLVIAVAAFLVSQAVPALLDNKANFLFDRVWVVTDSGLEFGIPDLLYVTVISAVIAMVVAVPIAVLVALFLTQYAPPRLAAPFGYLVDLLAAVPSIVYGLWGLLVFGPKVKPIEEWMATYFGWTQLFDGPVSSGAIFVACLVLAIMILPIVTAISREVFAQTPSTHKEGALALGATRWEMIRTAVLPFGTPGVISAAMLGLGRALGETVAVMIIVSTNPGLFRFSVFSGGETFASKIANSASEFGTAQKAGAYIAAGLVLFILTFLVNAAARIIIERRKAFSE